MKKFSYIIALLLISSVLFAQQKPLFSNYVFNDYYYNPAIASTQERVDFRLLYRNQWAGLNGKPSTQTFSANTALKKFPLGIGGNVYHDKTGPLRTFGFNVGISYGIKFKNKSMLSAGVSVGMVHLRLQDDINVREGGDVAILNAQKGKAIPDAGLGVYYKWKGLYVGFSLPQLFQSKIKLEVDDPNNLNKLVRHYFLAAGYKVKVADKFELEPSFLLKAVKAAPLQGDISLKAIYNNLVWLGATYRTKDATVIYAGVTIKDMFDIGYSYDITTSNLNGVSQGSHEVLLAYRLKKGK